MPDDRISLRQLLALLFAALLAPAIGVLPSQTAALAVNDRDAGPFVCHDSTAP